MFKSKTVRYSLEKNKILKSTRDISFEDVILALENGYLLDDVEHPNKEKYPNQNIFIILIQIKDYVYLVPYVEDDEWQSRGSIDNRIKELQSYVKNQKKKAISIRVGENDIYELKKKALESGVPYQNIIQMLIHQFVSNKIQMRV